jgi:hypothetical protein
MNSIATKISLKMPKGWYIIQKNSFKSDNSNVVMSKNIKIIFCYQDDFVLLKKYTKNLRNDDHRKLGK